jgi:hypothetical protein
VRSKTITVQAVNDAPLLNNTLNPQLVPSDEDAAIPASTLVANLIKDAVIDPDGPAARGIAVTTASDFHGQWQFSLNNGGLWQAMGAPIDGDARLLPGAARVRFLPKPNFNGNVLLHYRAWDQTQGSAGQIFDVGANVGGDEAFSELIESAVLTIKALNDKPVLSFSGSINYVHDKPAVTLVPGATLLDVDSANFAGGRLRVRIDVGAGNANRVAIGGGFTIDSNQVLLNGIVIGTRTSSGVGTSDLMVTFNTKATPSIVQQLVRAITFKTVLGAAGTRTVLFSVSDGDGGLSAEVTKTVNVT